MRTGLFVASFALAFAATPLVAAAQTFTAAQSGTPFTISVRPQYPAPYGTATISLLSDSLNLANASMIVSLGGKEIYRGAVQPVSVPLGKAGSVANVKVTVTSSGMPYAQSVFIQPQDVVLVVEPISSTHPLYQGKPLIPLEGGVRVVAMANFRDAGGRAIDPAALSYAWTVDNTQIASASGIGRQAIMVASPLQYRERMVSVAVTSQDGGLVGGASFPLSSEAPSVRIYESDPLLGVRFDHAISGQYTITGAEATLFAVPFSLPTTLGAPVVQWFLNGSPAQTGSSVTLRPSGSGQGSATLSLTASSDSLTPATASLSLSFGAAPSFSIFGL
ncbi:MAG: hypothetical protein KGH56_00940 [Patescibacteria group bacterium]|nr:hypothetical protein [Patescibacteria group bacterium]